MVKPTSRARIRVATLIVEALGQMKTFTEISSRKRISMTISHPLDRRTKTSTRTLERINTTASQISSEHEMLVGQGRETLTAAKGSTNSIHIIKILNLSSKTHNIPTIIMAHKRQLEKVQDQTTSTSTMST